MSVRAGGSDLAWRFLGAGFAVTAIVAAAPGSPVGPSEWPARGPFGAFTWVAWFVSATLAASLGELAAVLTVTARRRVALLGRAVPAALMFSLLAVAAFTAASRSDQIVRRPAASLLVAVAALIALRAIAARLDDSVRGGRGADAVD